MGEKKLSRTKKNCFLPPFSTNLSLQLLSLPVQTIPRKCSLRMLIVHHRIVCEFERVFENQEQLKVGKERKNE
jgi:hypothetical protein